MKTEEKLNMTMLCDFYELTMGNGYSNRSAKISITYFDVYFRSVPDGGNCHRGGPRAAHRKYIGSAL